MYAEQKGLCTYCNDQISLTFLETASESVSVQELREKAELDNFITSHLLDPSQIDALNSAEKELYFTNINQHFIIVEHIIPKSPLKAPDVTFTYTNLALSCNGNKAGKNKQFRVTDTFCDHKKGGYSIEIKPTDPDCEDNFIFDADLGEIQGKTAPAISTIDTLGLNCTWLVIRRAAVIRSIFYSDNILEPVRIDDPAIIRERWAELMLKRPENHLPAFWSALIFIKKNEFPGLD